MTVSKEVVKKISLLSKLNIEGKELDKFVGEFNSILDYISKIEDCDVEGIKLEHNLENSNINPLEEDIAAKSNISRDKLLKNATDGRSENNYIRTSKIVGDSS